MVNPIFFLNWVLWLLVIPLSLCAEYTKVSGFIIYASMFFIIGFIPFIRCVYAVYFGGEL